jgi:hypothetical protein
VAVAISVISLMSFTLSKLSGNILTNGGFESGDSGWNKWWGLEIDKAEKHSGEASCRVVAQSNAWRGTTQIIACPEGAKKLKITGWIKTKDITPNGEPWNNARISVKFMKTEDNQDEENYVGEKYPPAVGEAKGTTDWKEYSRTYNIPAGCNYLDIGAMCGQAIGTAWFDDIVATIE